MKTTNRSKLIIGLFSMIAVSISALPQIAKAHGDDDNAAYDHAQRDAAAANDARQHAQNDAAFARDAANRADATGDPRDAEAARDAYHHAAAANHAAIMLPIMLGAPGASGRGNPTDRGRMISAQ